jgi:hypothetical protein
VNTLKYFHFREEIFRRHNPLDVVNTQWSNCKYRWDYTTYVWEEEEIQYQSITYQDVIFKRRGNPLGRIEDEQRVREAQNKIKEEAMEKETKKTTTLDATTSKEENKIKATEATKSEENKKRKEDETKQQ